MPPRFFIDAISRYCHHTMLILLAAAAAIADAFFSLGLAPAAIFFFFFSMVNRHGLRCRFMLYFATPARFHFRFLLRLIRGTPHTQALDYAYTFRC